METTQTKINRHLEAIEELLKLDPEYSKSLEISDNKVPKSLRESGCTIIILPSGTILEKCPPS